LNVILVGPFVGELFWEIFRFVPYINYLRFVKFKNEDIKFIVYTRRDRFDLYGMVADLFVSLDLNEHENHFFANCFRLDGFSDVEYYYLINKFKKTYHKKYNIIDHIYPDIKRFTTRWQFPKNKMIFEYYPRKENKKILEKYLDIGNKKIITISPRYRNGLKRNWKYWNEFFDLIADDKKLNEKFFFIICGKYPDYIPDKKNRFFDINNIPITNEISTIGLTTECIKKSILTIGSQSGIPNLSLLLKTPVFSWGNEEKQHTIEYNIKKTKVHFLKDPNFDLDYKIIFEKIKIILSEYDD